MIVIATASTVPTLGEGAYTIPDASRILGLPSPKLRRWVNGYWRLVEEEKKLVYPAHHLDAWGERADKAFNFYTLIELFIITTFREQGLSFKTIRQARQELADRFKTVYPFASHKLLHDGKTILIELDENTLMTLGTKGQTAFHRIVAPFCKNLDFSAETDLAERYWPLGRQSSVVVDPRHGFGRPTVSGTNIATETVYGLYRAGEGAETICGLYDLSVSQVDEAVKFEIQKAA
ncbi:MAG: DUF433 domain-containing protein [Planctomycetes bacterium]|nr:DUF433 domain-containing protein [Planctomycetota bacterium]